MFQASKAWQTIPVCSLKKRETSKKTGKQISLVAEIDEPETSALVKPRI